MDTLILVFLYVANLVFCYKFGREAGKSDLPLKAMVWWGLGMTCMLLYGLALGLGALQ